MKLVMLETNGNQRFVFSSPRLRENVGASYLITQLADWTEQAANCLGIDKFGWVSKSSGKVILTAATEDYARKLIGQVTRKAFSAAPGLDVSGVFVDMCDPGNEVKRPRISNRDLKEAHRKAAEYALNRPPAQARFSQMPFLQRGRDSALPASSRLGVCDEAKDDKETALSLSSRVCRHRANDARNQFMSFAREHPDLLEREDLLVRDPTMLEKMLEQSISSETADGRDRIEDERLSKVAVIHIDGNGVGGIMRDLVSALKRIPRPDFEEEVRGAKDYSTATEEDAPSDALRCFLLEINRRLKDAMQKSFLTAWLEVAFLAEKESEKEAEAHGKAKDEKRPDIGAIPVVPVILGGDDATVITDATYALPFTEKFLTAFEEETGKDALLKYLGPKSRQGIGGCAKSDSKDENAESAGENAERESKNAENASEKQGGPMTAAAGVAIVPRKFPFHIAYDLAERLIKSAKALGKEPEKECSTLNFHVLFDSTVLDPDELLRSYESFTRRPFKVISDVDLGVSDVDLGVSDVDLDVKAKEDRSVAKEIMESPHGHPTWKDMCKYTRLFIGLPQSQKSDKNPTGSPNEERGSLNEDLQGSPRKDLKGSPNEELRFPMTRATRIRKIQSDAAKRGMGEEISRLTREIFKTSIGQSESNIDEPKNRESGGKQKLDWNNPSSVAKKIVDEWNVALESLESARKSREEQKPNATQASGDLPQNDAGTKNSGRGAPSRKEQDRSSRKEQDAPNRKEQDAPNWKQLTPNDLFDLIELADLLPQSYLEELTRKETGQKGAAGQKSATDQHHQSDAIQEGVTGHAGKAGQGNSDSTSGNGPAAASQEARK